MKILACICLVLVCSHKWVSAGENKSKAKEKAAIRLQELLSPAAKTDRYIAATGPLPRPVPRTMDELAVLVPVSLIAPPQLVLPPLKSVRPQNPAEDAPLVYFRADPILPTTIQLATVPLVRFPSVDVDLPIPLPILAQPQRDRASLVDPTLEASIAATSSPVAIPRLAPKVYPPINLPDPFELSQQVRLSQIPEELPMPRP